MRSRVALWLLTLTSCASAPRPLPDPVCTTIRRASEAAALFARSGQPIVLVGDVALSCPCQAFARRLDGAGEQRSVNDMTEARRVDGAGSSLSCSSSSLCEGYVVLGEGQLRVFDAAGERALVNRCVTTTAQ